MVVRDSTKTSRTRISGEQRQKSTDTKVDDVCAKKTRKNKGSEEDTSAKQPHIEMITEPVKIKSVT